MSKFSTSVPAASHSRSLHALGRFGMRKARLLTVVVLSVAALLMLVLAGCGGGDLGTGPSAGVATDASPQMEQAGTGIQDIMPEGDTAPKGPVTTKDASAASVRGDVNSKADRGVKTAPLSVGTVKGEIIVDDPQAERGGNPAYWHGGGGYGVNGSMTWTYVNGNITENWMRWHSGQRGGQWHIEVYIPRNYGTTQNAVYHIQDSGRDLRCVTVNQNNIYDQWVNLGDYGFSGEPSVYLSDQTGESYSTRRMVGFDAVKFVGGITTDRIGQNLARAHAMLGTNPFGKFYCLRYVREWSALPVRGIPSAAAAEQYFRNKGVFHATSSPTAAPAGAWVFFRWSPYGHVAMRDRDAILIHQDNSTAGGGRIAHSTTGGLPCTGYVTWEDVLRVW